MNTIGPNPAVPSSEGAKRDQKEVKSDAKNRGKAGNIEGISQDLYPLISQYLGKESFKFDSLSHGMSSVTEKQWKTLAFKLGYTKPTDPKETTQKESTELTAAECKKLVLKLFISNPAILAKLPKATAEELQKTSKNEMELYQNALKFLRNSTKTFENGALHALLTADIEACLKPGAKFSRDAVSMQLIHDGVLGDFYPNVKKFGEFGSKKSTWNKVFFAITGLFYKENPALTSEQRLKLKEIYKHVLMECLSQKKDSPERKDFIKNLVKNSEHHTEIAEAIYECGFTTQFADQAKSFLTRPDYYSSPDFRREGYGNPPGVEVGTIQSVLVPYRVLLKFCDKQARDEILVMAKAKYTENSPAFEMVAAIEKLIKETPYYEEELKQKAAEAQKKSIVVEADQKQVQGPNQSPNVPSSVMDLD